MTNAQEKGGQEAFRFQSPINQGFWDYDRSPVLVIHQEPFTQAYDEMGTKIQGQGTCSPEVPERKQTPKMGISMLSV